MDVALGLLGKPKSPKIYGDLSRGARRDQCHDPPSREVDALGLWANAKALRPKCQAKGDSGDIPSPDAGTGVGKVPLQIPYLWN